MDGAHRCRRHLICPGGLWRNHLHVVAFYPDRQFERQRALGRDADRFGAETGVAIRYRKADGHYNIHSRSSPLFIAYGHKQIDGDSSSQSSRLVRPSKADHRD
jgi:hypothetical protein